ncbi:DUF3135 domain-containing protein [Ferrimonas lipolytica]|uniref:DUF3135 domain-containing protein n=1 Tax=Ferrimonas lipolytica TaxID=2724191 RepID=A0A6H1UCE9_9GAMM|nr:DUF3135 domain-containing protein [Ferrimonas lipolytica]QIZ76777.1 DUF3135 domain-containing protein [Ferrimonas lipolytica]
MRALPNFDQLRKLAVNDPRQLEQLRQEMIAETISNSSKLSQLATVQHHIDQRLSRCSNPTARLLAINSMMHDKLYQLSQILISPDYLSRQAKVLPFKK